MKLTRHPVNTPTFTARISQLFAPASTWLWRWIYRAYGGVHPGIDWAVPVGRPVAHVVNKGRVIFIGKLGGYGLTVKVRCEWDNTHTHEIGVMYNHLSRVSSSIAVGRLVTEGQVLGYSGGAKGDPNAGTSSGPHLHFAYWDTSLQGVGKEHFVNPMPYFREGGVNP